MNIRKIFSVGFAALFLAACGDSSDPSRARDVSYNGPENDVALTSTSDPTAIAASATGLGTGLSGVAGSGTALPIGVASADGQAMVRKFLRIAADARRKDAALVTGVVQSGSAACEGGGSMSITMKDQDGIDTTTQQGDYVQVYFRNCQDGDGGYMNGSLRLDVGAMTGTTDIDFDPTTIMANQQFSVTISFGQLFFIDDTTGEWGGFHGDVSLTARATYASGLIEFIISGDSIQGINGVGDQVLQAFKITNYSAAGAEQYANMGFWDASLTQSGWDLDARVCTWEFGGCLNIQTDPTFWQTPLASHPYTGALTVFDGPADGFDASDDFVKITAVSATSVELTWRLDGVAGGPETKTWSCLEDETTCPQ